MIPPFDDTTGYLPEGEHEATWDEFVERFGISKERMDLINGLLNAIRVLKSYGCKTIYMDGSFTTDKERIKMKPPEDIDVCWEEDGVDTDRLEIEHSVFWDFSNKRQRQKDKYGCEFFPASNIEADSGKTFLEFFQTDRDNIKKGIIKISIEKL